MAVVTTKRPLTTNHLDRVYRELDEVAVAVSVVGTRRQMMEKLIGYVQPVAEALVGTRPKVASVRGELWRTMHNARKARLGAREASTAIWAMASAVKATKDLVKRQRLGDVEPVGEAGGFPLLNIWGYTRRETAGLRQELRAVSRQINALGLEDALGTVVLDEKRAKNDAFRYDGQGDFIADPKRPLGGQDVLEAVGLKVWGELFKGRHREMWQRDRDLFIDAFVARARGESQSADVRARLTATVGRVASQRIAA